MNKGMSTLTEQVTLLRQDVAIIKSHYATRQHLAEQMLNLKTEMHERDCTLQEELAKRDRALQDELAKRDRTLQEELVKRDRVLHEELTQRDLNNRDAFTQVYKNIDALRTEFHQALNAHTKWIISTMAVMLGLGLSLAKLLF